ncbi:MAG: hypothetical protein AAF235_07905 [Planctomycetota bacterium]
MGVISGLGVVVGLMVFAVLVGVLAAGVWVCVRHSVPEFAAMGVDVNAGGLVSNEGLPHVRFDERAVRPVARRGRRGVIARIESLAAAHGLLVPGTLELRGMRTVDLGRELVRVERMADRSRLRAQRAGREAGRFAEAEVVA